MSGHSKWSTIKRKKAVVDAKRGKIFTQLARNITIASREGGGDPDMNTTLALAIQKAKAANMPKDNIERAIKRGTGESKDGVVLEKIMYEGYAPHGIALMIETITDNRNRTVGDLRANLKRANGNLGENGSVAWQFTQKSFFSVPAASNDFDAVFELAADAGAEDIDEDGESFTIFGPADAYKTIGDQFKAAGIETEEAELRMIPNQEIGIDTDEAVQVLNLIETLEDLDDVQKVDSNLEITDEALAKLE